MKCTECNQLQHVGREKSMLGLDLPNLVAPETDLNLARVVGDGYVNRAKP